MDKISLGNDDSECKRKPVIDVQPPYERLEAAARVPGLLLFEEQRHDYKMIKHYSMKTNEYLQCKWKQYIDAGKKVRLPLPIPDVNNGRFLNQHLQFIRGSSAKPNYKRQMRCGPGTDMYGPLPVSNDLHIRQTVAVPKRGKPKTAGNRVAKLKFKRH